MKIKQFHILIALLYSTFLFSCTTSSDPFHFKNQPVGGTIFGESWSYYFAVARPYLYSPDSLSVQLSDTVFSNNCTYARSEQGVSFTIPFNEGLFKLRGGFTNPQYVVLYKGNEERYALGGAVEITLIDTINGLVEGKIDATYDGSNSVNGYFTAHLCEQ